MERAWASDSMTQGPAMRKRGLLPPRRREPREISREVFIDESKISQALVGCGIGRNRGRI
jgi:hypothetical protein